MNDEVCGVDWSKDRDEMISERLSSLDGLKNSTNFDAMSDGVFRSLYLTLCQAESIMEKSGKRMNELRRNPRIVCPSCGSPDVRGIHNVLHNKWAIACSKCGIEIEVSANDLTDLEGACAVVNAAEKLRWQVNKTKNYLKGEKDEQEQKTE